MIGDDVSRLLSFVSFEAKMMQLQRKNLYKSVSDLQQKILKSHRLICLLPYYMFVIESKKQHKEPQKIMPVMSDLDLIISLLRPKKIDSFSDFTMMTQESSFILNYLETNSIDLAREVVKAKFTMNNLDYYHMMFQIIPSIFGYFHSQQHLNAATLFYQYVIDIISDKEKAAIRLLQPFLNSPATYRYIEFVMTKIFKKMILCDSLNKFYDSLFSDESSNSCKEYLLIRNMLTKKFLHYLTKGVSLLPDQILQIFRRIRNKNNDKWSLKNWYKLVFVVFIGPHFFRWSRSHFFNEFKKLEVSENTENLRSNIKRHNSSTPKKMKLSQPSLFSKSRSSSVYNSPSKGQKTDIITDIIANVMNDVFKRDFDLLIDSLCTAESSYIVPDMYKSFDKCSLQHYISVRDMIILTNFMNDKKILPTFIKMNMFHGFSEECLNGVFFVNVYQNDEPLKQSIEKPIVFPRFSIDQEVAHKFEEQNLYRSRLASLESLAYMEEKDELEFALEKSAKDPDFHNYVKTHIAFQYVETADSFEEFIESCRLLKEVKEWDLLQSSYLDTIFLAYLNHFRNCQVSFDLLPKKVQLTNQMESINEIEFDFQFNQFVDFTYDIDEYMNDIILKNNESKCASFQNKDKMCLYQNPKTMKYMKMFGDMNEYLIDIPLCFFKALRLFSMIPLVRFPEKYEIFMKFLAIIFDVFPKNNKVLFLLLIKKISASALLKIFLEISTFVIHNVKCFNCIQSDDIAKCQKFENVIYQTMAGDDEMFRQILQCQIYLQDFFAANKASVEAVCRKK